MTTKLLMTALAIALSMGVASAQHGSGKCRNHTQKPNKERPCTGIPGTNKTCTIFIDENKNGICDNFENGTCIGNCNGTGTPIGTRPQDGTGHKKGHRR